MSDMNFEAGFEDSVLCAASSYEQKFFFNENYDMIPKAVKEELRTICVLFVQDMGGIFLICFDDDGTVLLQTRTEEDDIYSDEIGAALLVRELRMKKQELWESLGLYYRVLVLGEDPSLILDMEEK